jgi:hypothetical protein
MHQNLPLPPTLSLACERRRTCPEQYDLGLLTSPDLARAFYEHFTCAGQADARPEHRSLEGVERGSRSSKAVDSAKTVVFAAVSFYTQGTAPNTKHAGRR